MSTLTRQREESKSAATSSDLQQFQLLYSYTTTCADMAPQKRASPALQEKIDRLRLPLAPLMPMPQGPVHPAFPRTILAYHMLTEEQLDQLAHHYHQRTPGFWTEHYPISVLWPRKLSAALPTSPISPLSLNDTQRRHSNPVITSAILRDMRREDRILAIDDFLAEMILGDPIGSGQAAGQRRWSAVLRNDAERIAIKKRKFGKFIGLVNMETPAAEVESRMRHDMERSVRALRRERRRREEEELSASKMR